MFPTVSVIIPSLKGNSQNLDRLKRTVLSSGIPEEKLEIITALGVSPNGRARDVAVPKTSGEYLIFMDDDVSFPEPEHLKEIVSFLETHEELGLCGPAQQIPENLDKKAKQRARQIPRTHVDTTDTFRETDMVTHACLAIPRELFIDIGMEHPNLISGTDPDLRQRVRQAGYKVGLVPGTRVYHPPITNFLELIQANFNGGRRSKWVKRHYPGYHLKADPEITDVSEYNHAGLPSKFLRHVQSFKDRLIGLEGWSLLAQSFYVLGYGFEIISPGNWVEPIPYPDPPGPDHPKWRDFLTALEQEGKVRWLHGPTKTDENIE